MSQTDPDAIIIADVKLLDASNSPLSQRPQWLGFDAGTLDSGTGDLNLRFFNLSDRPLILRDVVVQDLPRVMSINAMVRNPRIDDPVHDISDKPDRAFMRWDFEDKIGEVKKGAIRRPLLDYKIEIKPAEALKVPVASLGHGHHISLQRTDSDCLGLGPANALCQPGRTLDLFPATTMYIMATVVDPTTATVSNPDGVESRLFYQVAGRRLPP